MPRKTALRRRILLLFRTGCCVSGLLCITLPWGCSERKVRKFSIARSSILQERTEKDAAFRLDRDSPILPQDKSRFQGLAYFPVDTTLRFRVHLNRYPKPETVRLSTNTGEIRAGLRYGYINLRIDNADYRLQVYRLEDTGVPSGQARLFLPFRDSTSGKETYETGRYVDLMEDPSGFFNLDFNRAYNPFCAYGGSFSCPVPPAARHSQAGHPRAADGSCGRTERRGNPHR